MKLNEKGCAASREGKRLLGGVIFLAVFMALAAVFAVPMGIGNMLNTMMNTAYRLLVDTALYIMAIAVLAGALCAVFTEFGVLELLNRILSPLMKPLYGMPGAAALGVVTTYFSDNPAILSLADESEYRKYFKAYQIPALTNLGTAFGMGLIVTTYMLGLSSESAGSTGRAVLYGNLGAIAGSILSTRLMLVSTAKSLGREKPALDEETLNAADDGQTQAKRTGIGMRVIDAVLRGGKTGVDMGLAIIPGVLVICTIVLMLTNGPSESGAYTGAAYEGIKLLPMLAEKINFIIQPLFGFTSPECISVPVTALGSAGASLGIARRLFMAGQAGGNDIAVFTAMCMCWSGYLSTHVSMMDVLKCRRFAGKSILYHTFGGLFAGIVAHLLFMLVG